MMRSRCGNGRVGVGFRHGHHLPRSTLLLLLCVVLRLLLLRVVLRLLVQLLLLLLICDVLLRILLIVLQLLMRGSGPSLIQVGGCTSAAVTARCVVGRLRSPRIPLTSGIRFSITSRSSSSSSSSIPLSSPSSLSAFRLALILISSLLLFSRRRLLFVVVILGLIGVTAGFAALRFTTLSCELLFVGFIHWAIAGISDISDTVIM